MLHPFLVSLSLLMSPPISPEEASDECMRAVRSHSLLGRFERVASVAHDCYRKTQDGYFLFAAAQAQLQLTNSAAAYQLLRRYELTRGAATRSRIVSALIERSVRQTEVVLVSARGCEHPPMRVTCTSTERPKRPTIDDLSFHADSFAHFRLDPGHWSVEIECDGELRQESVAVLHGEVTFIEPDFSKGSQPGASGVSGARGSVIPSVRSGQLTPRLPRVPLSKEVKARRAVGVIFAGTAVPLIAVGASMVMSNGSTLDLDFNQSGPPPALRQLLLGVGVGSTGVGVGVAAASSTLVKARRAWYMESILGAGVFVLGIALGVQGSLLSARDVGSPDTIQDERANQRYLTSVRYWSAANACTGVGAGMATASLSSLIVDLVFRTRKSP